MKHTDQPAPKNSPTLGEATRIWWKIGILSFGGPAAQIALLHREVVEIKKWLSEAQFLNALSFCMLLPGPEAMQLATYAGWRLHGIAGGLIAGLLFIMPGAVIIMALAAIYALYGQVPLFAVFFSVSSMSGLYNTMKSVNGASSKTGKSRVCSKRPFALQRLSGQCFNNISRVSLASEQSYAS